MTPRWQPPHPDPRRGYTPPRSYVKPTYGEQERARDARPRLMCTWFECYRLSDPKLGIPMCVVHARIAHDKFIEHCDAEDAAIAEQRRRAADALAVATAKVEGGEPLAPTDPVPGWIYYVRIGDTVKIGFAKNVSQRMRQYPPTAALLAVEPGTPKIERARHSLFAAHLAHGREWFNPNPELDAWITQVLERHGAPDRHRYVYTTPADKKPVVAGKRMNRRW